MASAYLQAQAMGRAHWWLSEQMCDPVPAEEPRPGVVMARSGAH